MTFGIGRRTIADAVIAFALVLLIGPLQAVAAEIINIQFQSPGPWNPSGPAYTGAGLIGGADDKWNHLTNGSGSDFLLSNSAGLQTGTSVSWTGTDLFSSGNGFSSQSESALMHSYLYASGSNTITFSNLPGKSYNLFIYTQGAYDGVGRQLVVTVNGQSQTSAKMDPSASTFISGQNYLEFSGNIDTNTPGVLLITYSAIGTSGGGVWPNPEADINGIQLSSHAPEPSTYVLMGIGGIVIALRFKKRYLSIIGIKAGK